MAPDTDAWGLSCYCSCLCCSRFCRLIPHVSSCLTRKRMVARNVARRLCLWSCHWRPVILPIRGWNIEDACAGAVDTHRQSLCGGLSDIRDSSGRTCPSGQFIVVMLTHRSHDVCCVRRHCVLCASMASNCHSRFEWLLPRHPKVHRLVTRIWDIIRCEGWA